MSRYRLRPVTAADYDFLFSLHSATMRETVAQIWGWDDDTQARIFRERFDMTNRRVIVVDGADVGVLEVERRPNAIYVANIEIAPGRQGRGLGAAVLQDLLAEGRERGLPVTLQVNRVNRARRLYERLGFVETGRTETHILMRAGP